MPVRRLLPLAALALTFASAPRAQPARLAPGPRVLFSVSDVVKLDDGTVGPVETTLTYDPAAGEYRYEVRDQAGALVARSVRQTSVAAPTATEDAVARRVIAAHPEVARLAAGAAGPVVIDGGFPLVREPGHPCGPGSRCVTYDVFETTAGGRRRLRYVVVDLRDGRVLNADADSDADGNRAPSGPLPAGRPTPSDP